MRTNLSQILILLEMREETLCSSDNADVARRPKLLIEYKTYASAGSNGVDDIYVREIGKKRYELSDHLGNVRVVVKDLKNAVLKSAIKKDNFDTGVSNWLAANNYNSLLIENKKLKVSYEGTATTGTGAYFTASVTSGKTYVWKFDLEIGTAPSIRYYATMGSNYMGLKHVNEGGSYTVRFTATTTGTVTLKTEASAAGNYQYSVDNSIFAEEGSFEPEIISAETYYPFGMPMPGRTYNNDQYRFGYNGQEKSDEIAGTGNHNTAEFWEYDTRLGRRWNLDPKPNVSISSYAAFTNNPIFYNDILGDSVNTANLYSKNERGKYKNPAKIFAFELFASTKEGNKYIKDRAQKGFELNGVFMKKLQISASEDGVLHSKGIDVSFHLGSLDEEARTDDEIVGGRLKLKFTIDNSINRNLSYRENVINDVDDYSHETFLHGNLKEQSFLNSEFGLKAYSHSKESLQGSNYGSGYGVSILNQVQSMPIKLNHNQIRYSKEFLWYNIMMPGLGYKPNPSIKN